MSKERQATKTNEINSILDATLDALGEDDDDNGNEDNNYYPREDLYSFLPSSQQAFPARTEGNEKKEAVVPPPSSENVVRSSASGTTKSKTIKDGKGNSIKEKKIQKLPENQKTTKASNPRPVLGPPRPPPPPTTTSSVDDMDDVEAENLLAGFMDQMMTMMMMSGDDHNNRNMDFSELQQQFLLPSKQPKKKSTTTTKKRETFQTSHESSTENKNRGASAASVSSQLKASTKMKGSDIASQSTSSSTKTKWNSSSPDCRSNNTNSNHVIDATVTTDAEIQDAISNLIKGISQVKQEQQQRKDNHKEDGHNEKEEQDEEALILKKVLEGLQNCFLNDNINHDDGDDEGGHSLKNHDTRTTQAEEPADALMDGIMEQLMSKELMYEPMKQVALRFPDWLQENRTKLSDSENVSRQAQCALFQRIVETYEATADGTSMNRTTTRQLLDLMQQVQEYGQPPTEIIQAIAPGLEFDEEGVPKLDFRELLLNDNKSEECCIL